MREQSETDPDFQRETGEMRGWLLIAAPLFFAGCSSAPSVEVPPEAPSHKCERVPYTSLCDSDIRVKFPEILSTDKILDSDIFDDDWPVTVIVRYTPEDLGEHAVLTKTVICTQYNDATDFKCQLIQPKAYYYTDPDEYLVATDAVQPDQVMLIVKLLMQRKITAAKDDWKAPLLPQDIRWYSLDEHHGTYILTMVSSGCGGSVHIRVDGIGEDEVLSITEPPDVICH